jgi:hypothetical protein
MPRKGVGELQCHIRECRAHGLRAGCQKEIACVHVRLGSAIVFIAMSAAARSDALSSCAVEGRIKDNQQRIRKRTGSFRIATRLCHFC